MNFSIFFFWQIWIGSHNLNWNLQTCLWSTKSTWNCLRRWRKTNYVTWVFTHLVSADVCSSPSPVSINYSVFAVRCLKLNRIHTTVGVRNLRMDLERKSDSIFNCHFQKWTGRCSPAVQLREPNVASLLLWRQRTFENLFNVLFPIFRTTLFYLFSCIFLLPIFLFGYNY